MRREQAANALVLLGAAGLIGGALFVFGIERFLPTAIAEPAEIGVVEPTRLR